MSFYVFSYLNKKSDSFKVTLLQFQIEAPPTGFEPMIFGTRQPKFLSGPNQI
jgi:hypothetical protein